MLKELVSSTHSILKEKTIPFDFENPPMSAIDLADEMRYNLCKHRGIGLSAPQIGYNFSVFAAGNPEIEESVLVFFNPNIVHYSDNIILMEEGCLSFPGIILKIKRPDEVRMRYTGAGGQTKTDKFGGMTARVIQHECDHLQGITFDSNVSSFHWNRAKKKRKIMNRRIKHVA
jgi:peptide deformylase